MSTIFEAQKHGFEKALTFTPRHLREFLSAELEDLQDPHARICPACGRISKPKPRRFALVPALAVVFGIPALVVVMTVLLGPDAVVRNSLIVAAGVIMLFGVGVEAVGERLSRECGHCHEAKLMPLSAEERAALSRQAREQLDTQAQGE